MMLSIITSQNITAITSTDDLNRPGESVPVSVNVIVQKSNVNFKSKIQKQNQNRESERNKHEQLTNSQLLLMAEGHNSINRKS